MQQGDGGGGQCGVVAYTPRTGETRTCQTSPVSGGDRSLISCMHTHASPPVPSPPVYTHPLTAVRPLLPLFGLCCLCSSSSFSRERTCRNANNSGLSTASHTYVHTYIQTDRQTERGAQCLHVSSHRLLVLGLLCLLHTHTNTQ